MDFFQSFGKEAALTLVLGFVAARFFNQMKAITPSSTAFAMKIRPELISATETFSTDELLDLTRVWGDDKPEGKFLKARHGITHYKIDRRSNDDQMKSKSKGMIVLGHGLGQSLKMYQEFSDILVQNGFSVLRYDYFGHGYGKYVGDNMWMKYTPDMFVDQLEDLLDHVYEEEKEEIVAFVGHSNGGVNGISANFRWSSNGSDRKVIPKMVLVNPAIYTNKPLVARIADGIPGVLRTLMMKVPPARVLVGDSYLEALDVAFGKDSKTNEYLYPKVYQECKENTMRLFGRVKGIKAHPFLSAAVFGVSSYNIPGKLLPMHQERLSKIVKIDNDKKSDTLFVWGDLDVTVPYKENVDTIRKMAKVNDNFKLEILNDISHECFLENSSAVARVVVPFIESK
jgi:pimeloyl-ACP methyl ester carboxylesterase